MASKSLEQYSDGKSSIQVDLVIAVIAPYTGETKPVQTHTSMSYAHVLFQTHSLASASGWRLKRVLFAAALTSQHTDNAAEHN